MPKALQATKPGAVSGNLNLIDVPILKPAKGSVVIKTHSVAINPVDWKMTRDGLFVPQWPFVPGIDASGTVVEVDDAAKEEFTVGDEVWGLAYPIAPGEVGSFAEYIAPPAGRVFKKPKSITFEEAASLGVAADTAVEDLFTPSGFGFPTTGNSGTFLLILGGASSVGLIVTQLAARAGLTVIVTVSKKNAEYLKSLGAHHTIDYTLPLETQAAQINTITNNSLSYVLDTVGEAALSLTPLVTRKNPSSLILSIVFAPQPDPDIPYRTFPAGTAENRGRAGELIRELVLPGLEEGWLKPNRVRVVEGGLEEGVKTALEESAAGRVSGEKLVVKL
ncbi:hypothetical protein HDV00_002980 [Rhizophlyctis rosea]|nr:hypothetical protein HDV00_002980 [Rhizophlyctis rosea]